MQQSFVAHGFTPRDTEYLVVDNSSQNQADAYVAYNAFLVEARAPYIVLCHQDVLLLDEGRKELDALLVELHARDENWGLCGNAGVKEDGTIALRITDPRTANGKAGGPFPARVATLDENFIVVRRAANLALSRDLAGFHMYGTDLCIISHVLGWSAYVISFHLLHKSGGTTDHLYYRSRDELRSKYMRALSPRWVALPTHSVVLIAGSKWVHKVAGMLWRLGIWPRFRTGKR